MKNRGITLIALVITIIVLIILAAVSLVALTGEDGIITNAIKSSFATEMQEVKEKINLKKQEIVAEIILTGQSTNLFNTNVNIKDKIPNTLKQEIMYFRDGADSSKISSDYNVEDFEKYITQDNSGNIESIWKVEGLEKIKDGIYMMKKQI